MTQINYDDYDATRSYGNYDFALKTVERPTVTTDKYGQGEVLANCLFQDAMMSIGCVPKDGRSFDVILKNKTDGNLKVNWNEGALVDADGTTHPISHSTVKIIDLGKSQLPSIVPKGSALTENIFPSDKVTYDKVLRCYYVIPLVAVSDPERRKEYIGKTIRLILPVETEGVTHVYTFVFELGAAPEQPKDAKAATRSQS
jgi:hypothetical protein